MISQETKDAILEAQVTAALQGHDLGPFEPVDLEIGDWQTDNADWPEDEIGMR